MSRMEGAYKELLDNLEATPEIIYEDKSRARFICFIHELAYRTKSFRDRMDAINFKTEEVLNKLPRFAHSVIFLTIFIRKINLAKRAKHKQINAF